MKLSGLAAMLGIGIAAAYAIDPNATARAQAVTQDAPPVHHADDLGRPQFAVVPGGTPQPPTQLPEGKHAAGATYSITMNSGGFIQSWDYTHMSGSTGLFWSLTGYAVRQATPTKTLPMAQ